MPRVRNNPNEFFTCPGSPVAPVFNTRYDSDGVLEVYSDGEFNLQDSIQSFAPSTDIRLIISRLQSGDSSAVRNDGVYADFTALPKTYHDFLNFQIRAEQAFNNLPMEERLRFNNSLSSWASSVFDSLPLSHIKQPISNDSIDKVEVTPVES